MDEYKTATEIKANNPHLDWSLQQIGSLYWLGLVRGKKKTRNNLMHEQDVLAVYQNRIDV